MKILQDVYLAGGGAFGYSHPSDCNIYLVDGGDELALIDTGGGAGVDAVLSNIRNTNLDPKKVKVVFITHSHFDHIGGNKRVKELTGCKIAVHESVATAVEKLDPELTLVDMARRRGLSIEPAKVDLPLRDGEVLKVGRHRLRVIHTPGHTPGSTCLLMESGGKRTLFSGDIVSAQGRLNFINGPGFDLVAWKRSMKTLLDLKVDALMPGHGTFVLSNGHDHIKLYSDKLNAPWVNIVTSIDLQ
ncbi:MAG: MBL fold metallo-hydrolase [Candidatus Bathyarchaeia archaeon]